jgi:hypothetical protein
VGAHNRQGRRGGERGSIVSAHSAADVSPYDTAFYARHALMWHEASTIVLPIALALLDCCGYPGPLRRGPGAGVGPWLSPSLANTGYATSWLSKYPGATAIPATAYVLGPGASRWRLPGGSASPSILRSQSICRPPAPGSSSTTRSGSRSCAVLDRVPHPGGAHHVN